MNIRVIARRAFFDKFFVTPSMPEFLRMALSDSMSYDKAEEKGGAINNFRNAAFKKLKIHHGMNSRIKDLNEIHKDGNQITIMLSSSDLIQIGGAAAVQYCGGPFINVR